ncbi:hypothetical protein HanIR_Chr10g0490511 [Helianthus annuus]|nr:hypothetical protein HanIR_Chr10g0490511 [Helianthus annuus]
MNCLAISHEQIPLVQFSPFEMHSRSSAARTQSIKRFSLPNCFLIKPNSHIFRGYF